MNIFEIMASSEHLGKNFFANILVGESPWIKLQTIIDTLFNTCSFNTNETKTLWNHINETSKDTVRLCFQYYIYKLNQELYHKDVNQLREIIQKYPKDNIEEIALYLNNRFNSHYEFLNVLTEPKDISSSIKNEFASALRMILLDEIKIDKLFNQYFEGLHGKHSKNILENSIVEYDDQTKQFVIEKIERVEGAFDNSSIKKVIKLISDLGFYDECLESINAFISSDIKEFVNKFQDSICQNTAYLVKCEIYYDSFHQSFLKMFAKYFLQCTVPEKRRQLEIKLYKNTQSSKNKIYLSYGQLLSKNVFSIALDYPESERLVKELRKCIEKVNLISQVSSQLQYGIKNRLLTPGVVTRSILDQYINMLKILQIIDPVGQVYEQITNPIKTYLLKRTDTLRCIITLLMEDEKQNNSTRLGTHLVKLPSKQYGNIDSDDEYDNATGHSLERKMSIKYQQIDFVTVLVNLYGSQQSFISEYQVMLAQKLMGSKDFNIDDQVMSLEKLKQRFGQQTLQACNIIVKDYKDSKKIDNFIGKQAKIVANQILQQKDLHTITVSKGYWPINYEGHTFNLPKVFRASFDSYVEKFSKIKAMRKIQFHYDLGYVNIVLDFANGSVPFKCLPIHAVMISFFDETKNRQKRVSVEYLAKQLDLPQAVIRQRLSFWIHKGVIRPSLSLTSKPSISLKRLNSYEQNSVQYYTTVDVYKKPLNSDDSLQQADEMIIKQGSFEAKVKLAQDLIQKIVHFNGPKSAQQICLLLKTVYKSQMNFDFTEAQAKQILKKMVSFKRLLFNEQVYSYCGKNM